MRYVPLVALLVLTSCTRLLVTSELESYEPPEVYRAWFGEMVECTGETWLEFETLEFYRADAVHYKLDEWRAVGGAWVKPYDIVIDRDQVHQRHTVAHEMVHALMQDGHPSVDATMKACGVL